MLTVSCHKYTSQKYSWITDTCMWCNSLWYY